jgi:murein DD-endopeptidase MepM/ murein hydrolase activator NlpD
MTFRLQNFLIISTLFSFALLGCDEGRTPTSEPYELPDRNGGVSEAQWPLSRDQQLNSDISYAQYGPRSLPGGYDFHAGIDLYAPEGTMVYPVLPGEVVQLAEWDGQSTGAGNAITIRHSDTLATSYLHLYTMHVGIGDRVGLNDVVGTVGSTGATYPHLHLGYFVNLPNPNVRDERYSRNPLEILPHRDPGEIPYTFMESGEIVLDLPLQSMTVNSVELIGGNQSRKADYYNIVAKGWSARKEQVQFGIHFDAARRTSDHMRFDLTVKPENMEFLPERIILRDFNGTVLLDATNE